MAGLGALCFTTKKRPCYYHEVKCLFHGWCNVHKVLFNNVITETAGIIEFEYGGIAKVDPEDIRFADNEFKEYAFIPMAELEKERDRLVNEHIGGSEGL